MILPRQCAACGALLPENSGFCPQCGKLVAARPGAPAPPVPDNLAAVLTYFFLPALAFLFWEAYRRNQFVRFHCLQAILYCVAAGLTASAIMVIGMIPAFAILSIPLGMVFFCGTMIWAAALMVKAYQGERYKLPIIGEVAEQYAAR
jgi:uncharacterized membrane protein